MKNERRLYDYDSQERTLVLLLSRDRDEVVLNAPLPSLQKTTHRCSNLTEVDVVVCQRVLQENLIKVLRFSFVFPYLLA